MEAVISQSLMKTPKSGIAAGDRRVPTEWFGGVRSMSFDKEIIEEVIHVCAKKFLRTSIDPFSNTTKVWHSVSSAKRLPIQLVQVNLASVGVVNSRDGVSYITWRQGHLPIRGLQVLCSHEYVLRLCCQVL